jgi:hypothetical protein
MDEAGQYERAQARRGGTAWDAARTLVPGTVFLPGSRRDAIVRGAGRPGTGGFPAGWDADMITGTVLAAARDPDLITWDDPAAWPGTDITGQPCWRAEGAAGGVTIIGALTADGEILGARTAGRPRAACGLGPPPAARQPGRESRQREGTRA